MMHQATASATDRVRCRLRRYRYLPPRSNRPGAGGSGEGVTHDQRVYQWEPSWNHP